MFLLICRYRKFTHTVLLYNTYHGTNFYCYIIQDHTCSFVPKNPASNPRFFWILFAGFLQCMSCFFQYYNLLKFKCLHVFLSNVGKILYWMSYNMLRKVIKSYFAKKGAARGQTWTLVSWWILTCILTNWANKTVENFCQGTTT